MRGTAPCRFECRSERLTVERNWATVAALDEIPCGGRPIDIEIDTLLERQKQILVAALVPMHAHISQAEIGGVRHANVDNGRTRIKIDRADDLTIPQGKVDVATELARRIVDWNNQIPRSNKLQTIFVVLIKACRAPERAGRKMIRHFRDEFMRHQDEVGRKRDDLVRAHHFDGLMTELAEDVDETPDELDFRAVGEIGKGVE